MLSKLCDPPYRIGDILYVREMWKIHALNPGNCMMIRYKADNFCNLQVKFSFERFEKFQEFIDKDGWLPSLFMPKEAARIWLKVTDVRVERLQDIAEEQATAEGAIDNRGFINSPENEYQDIHSAREYFKKIWNSTIKKPDLDHYGWESNPWVWVIEFERCGKPEPCIIAGMEPAEDKRPCIGYGRSEDDDEPCEMCKGCSKCSGNDV